MHAVMSTAEWIGLTLAFLAPLPPEWERDASGRPDLPRPNGLVVGLVAGFLLAVTLVPLGLALAENRTLTAFGAQCRAAGGRVTHLPAEDGKPYRCDHRN
ncbi:hypothetical protein [Methylobacterium sp. A54F]